MSRRRFVEQERRLAEELSTKFRGTASVDIAVLDFPFKKLRDEDEKNTERLEKLFKKQKGCRDWDIFNHIPALIQPDQLDAALERSNISSEALLEARDGHLQLDFPAGFLLSCLRGQHRALAAKASRGITRWTVDLYDSGMLHLRTCTTLIEEYSCEKKPDDGEIYSKIREYQGYGGGGNPYFESRWWALLHGISSHKSDNMKQIIRNPDFRAAFDIQLDVPGLGGGMSLGSTHKVFGMKCHELMLSYLDDNIRGFWTKIFRGDRQAMLKVSRADVKALELKAPGACRSDRISLHGQLREGKIFGAFTEREREAMWPDILSETTDRLIPSLSSFFADVHYLKGPADCVKALVELWPDETVPSALERIFSDANQETDRCIIQQSESTFISIPGNRSDRLELGVLQIWIGAMRDYLEMLPEKEDDSLVAKPRSQPNERIGYEFASLAYRLGFESEEIRYQIQRSPDEEIARKTLLKARDPTRYKYDDADVANFVG
ncbi:hypothetical protein K491DRAFT_614063 [Lophiostoma macrostomum CBS 122681]|uniref:Uncharacterized protein n=1 Tax=Lophiostoma macrostomum CBS 122681 TaxID=1314788 RepID=A0A6A6SIR5_9PLEO|nr:hypothetical protein K491DRAFT_614063 [Lophiostoma macrostomum CBS 122681]